MFECICRYFGALYGEGGTLGTLRVPSAPGLVFRWILGGILGPLGHPLGANGTHNAAQNRRERLTEAVLEEV